jgi:hypothetical protein
VLFGLSRRGDFWLSFTLMGKYVKRYRQGTNVVLLDPDVAEKFPTSESVNEALRRLAGRGRG